MLSRFRVLLAKGIVVYINASHNHHLSHRLSVARSQSSLPKGCCLHNKTAKPTECGFAIGSPISPRYTRKRPNEGIIGSSPVSLTLILYGEHLQTWSYLNRKTGNNWS
jgi:hypothetical protein